MNNEYFDNGFECPLMQRHMNSCPMMERNFQAFPQVNGSLEDMYLGGGCPFEQGMYTMIPMIMEFEEEE